MKRKYASLAYMMTRKHGKKRRGKIREAQQQKFRDTYARLLPRDPKEPAK